jgi:rRNA maturation endonuclease Nob1
MLEVTIVKNTMYPGGKYTYVCPGCGRKHAFFMYQSHNECLLCGEPWPDIKKMITQAAERLDYHKYGGKDE